MVDPERVWRMSMAGKWDPIAQKYNPYKLPDKATEFADLDEVIQCAECGRELTYGEAFTSRLIHSSSGSAMACVGNAPKESMVQGHESISMQ